MWCSLVFFPFSLSSHCQEIVFISQTLFQRSAVETSATDYWWVFNFWSCPWLFISCGCLKFTYHIITCNLCLLFFCSLLHHVVIKTFLFRKHHFKGKNVFICKIDSSEKLHKIIVAFVIIINCIFIYFHFNFLFSITIF